MIQREAESWMAAAASDSIAANVTGEYLVCAPCVKEYAGNAAALDELRGVFGSAELRIATSADIKRCFCCHACGADLGAVLS